MDTSKISVNNWSGVSGAMIGSGLVMAKSVPSQQILPMIEQRIRDEVEPQVKQAREDMEHAIVLKLEQLGINPNLTSLYSFARDIADKYREQLVGERIKAIVDGLVNEKPVVIGVDMADGSDKAGYFVSYPGPLTPLQRDEIRRILNQVPQPTPKR